MSADEMPQPDPPIGCMNIREPANRVTSLELALIRERAIEGTATAEDAEKLERVLMEALDRLGCEHDEREAAVRRAEEAEGELASQREGESEPPAGRPAAGYTPTEWLYDWNRQTPDERLATIDRIYEASRLMAACILGRHEEHPKALPDLIRVAAYVSRGRGFVDLGPYPDALARRALGALDDATIDAALNQPADTSPAEHAGGNAGDCPVCSGRRDLPYPFVCPGADQRGEMP